MSKFLDRFRYFKQKGETFADGHGQLLNTNRDWEDGYRQRWQHDKIVRSTHGVNCTGSCSWKIYVKNGLVTWETQQTDYPRTRPDLPNHEPRGCPRGASYSWYLYSANRLKYPMMRKRLMKMWREAKALHSDPVEAWASIIEDADKAKSFKQARGRGGFVRSSWQEVNELIAASNVYTIKNYGPDRVAGFSPIPAMSMVSYASGARYLSLIGGTCLSFYDWYCDLPPASPQTWGEQTDVPESADWYNSSYIIAWGSNVPQTRTPDAHFFTEVRYKGTKTVAVTPDYAEIAKLCDLWLAPKQGTDAAMALAMGHVMLREFHLDNPSQYFTDYVRRYKGVTPVEPVKEIHQIAVDGKFDDWTALGTRYKDYKGDTRPRNHWGFGYKNISLTNNTGRNDICYAKVATDCKSLFFHVETAEPITPRTDRNWMRHFISVKGSTAPAWEGFQWVVNNRVVGENRTTLQRSKGGWDWEEAATVDYAVSGNQMEIAIPLSELGITDVRDFTVDFKWIDNAVADGDIRECMRDGDSAPGDRFRYRYIFKY